MTRRDVTGFVTDFLKTDDVQAIWQMQRADIWFLTFKNEETVNNLDGQELKFDPITIYLQACDRIRVQMRIHWLPLWVNNEDIEKVVEKYGDVEKISWVEDEGILTGVRRVTFRMKEGDQEHIPYLTNIYGHKCLFVIPGRPPVCFRCEEVGHLRGECPHFGYSKTGPRSYASVVQSRVVGKPMQAVGKPNEKSDVVSIHQGELESPQTKEVVGIPQEESLDSPKDTEDHDGPQEDQVDPHTVGESGDDSLIRELLSGTQYLHIYYVSE